jgi:hypothetical protein
MPARKGNFRPAGCLIEFTYTMKLFYVQVVPITRLRRATTWWTYSSPAALSLGQLVYIPFQGRSLFGVVWATLSEKEKELAEKKHTIIQSIERSFPLIPVSTGMQRAIELGSELGICSLSSSLLQWMPVELRPGKHSPALFSRLAEPRTQSCKPQVVLLPNQHAPTLEHLQKIHGPALWDSFSQSGLTHWLNALSGSYSVVVGREKALSTPGEIASIHLYAPEDLSYYHEQVPYLWLHHLVQTRCKESAIPLSMHSFLPQPVQQAIFTQASTTYAMQNIQLWDMRRTTNLVQELDLKTQGEPRKWVIFHPFTTRTKLTESGSLVIPGRESLSRQLRERGNLTPVVDTKQLHTATASAYIFLESDTALTNARTADILQLYMHIGRASTHGKVWVCTRNPDHAALQQLVSSQPVSLVNSHAWRQQRGFEQPLLRSCSYPGNDMTDALSLREQLLNLVREGWNVGYPLSLPVRGKPFVHLPLLGPLRLPVALRETIAKLPSPWRVQCSPWFLV